MGTMKLLSAPFLLFGGSVVAFSGWVAYEFVHAPTVTKQRSTTAAADRGEEPSGPPAEVIIGGLHVGMPRPVAEQHLSVFAPPHVEPLDASAGTTVLRSRYRVNLRAFVPHLMPGTHPHAFRPGPYVLTVEFDGEKPEHPLVRATLEPVRAE